MKKIILIYLFSLFLLNVQATNTSTIVMDIDSGRILYQNNAYEKKLIASTTKIMTFVIAYEYGKDYLDLPIETGEEILKMYGTSIYLSLHEKMTLRDLMYGLMLRSANDAAVVIANFIGGSEDGFVKLMNLKAQKLGMNNTIFSNPHGLDEQTQNYSTAYDMALLSCYANKISFYKEVTSTKYYKVQTEEKAYSWTNRNKLLFNYPYLISGKTGYTPTAGRTFVTASKKDNFTITVVSLNDNNIYENHRILAEDIFNRYRNYTLINHLTYPIKEEIDNNKAYIKDDFNYPLLDSEIKFIKEEIILNKEKNNIIGYIKIYYKEKEIGSINIYEEKVKKKESNNFFQRILKKIF